MNIVVQLQVGKFKKNVKNIWKDPVWSKVISVGILGLITVIYAKIESIIGKITYKDAFLKAIQLKIPIFYILIFIIIYWIFLWLKSKFKKKNEDSDFYTKKQKDFVKNNKTVDNEHGLLYKWDVFFNYNNTPFILNLTIFCTEHGDTPLKFIGRRCSVSNCKNYVHEVDLNKVKNIIESDLINRWDNSN